MSKCSDINTFKTLRLTKIQLLLVLHALVPDTIQLLLVILLQFVGLLIASSSGNTSLFCGLPHLKLNGRRPLRFLGDGVSGFGRSFSREGITAS